MSDSQAGDWEGRLEEQLAAMGIPDSQTVVGRWKRVRERRIAAALRTISQHRESPRQGDVLADSRDRQERSVGTTADQAVIARRLEEVRDRLVDTEVRVSAASAAWNDGSRSLQASMDDLVGGLDSLRQTVSGMDRRDGVAWQGIALGTSLAVVVVVLGLMLAPFFTE